MTEVSRKCSLCFPLSVGGHSISQYHSASASQAGQSNRLNYTAPLSDSSAPMRTNTSTPFSSSWHCCHTFPSASKNLSGKCDCKIIALGCIQPASPLLTFLISKDTCAAEETGPHSPSQTLWFPPLNVTVNVSWLNGPESKALQILNLKCIKRINILLELRKF